MISPRLTWLLPEPITDPPHFDGFDAPVATLLARRGIADREALARFLTPSADTLHPLALMADADRALDRIERALVNGERIAIWGDYDADGMSAVAVWVLALRRLGTEPLRYVPSRLAEGYGLSVEGLQRLAGDGVGLVVTCDCGVVNVPEVAFAHELGMEVVVTDHHLPGPKLPPAAAVVDPHRADCRYPDVDLTGAGLAFRLATALLERHGMVEPDLAAVAAIGTIADLAPMTGESRTIVGLGLAELAATRRAGLRALLARSVPGGAPSGRDLAFAIAPRINAAGRIADAELAMGLLVEEEPERAERIADELEEVHRRRRALTTAAIAEARAAVAGTDGAPAGLGPLALRNDDWEPGLIGLIAGRLADDLGRPVAIASTVPGELRGSVRAPDDFHVAAALEACAAHLAKRGGHAGAGGFSLDPAAWSGFVEAFEALPRPYPADRAPVAGGFGSVTVDLVLPAGRLGWPLAEQMARLGPFGPGNAEPVLAVTGLRVIEARRVGRDEAHIQFRMRRGLEAFDAVAFGAPADWPLPEPGSAVDLVGRLERDRYEGIDRLRLRMIDYADAAASPLLARRRAPPARPVLAAPERSVAG